MQSPPLSRSPSTQGSYSTGVTAFDEADHDGTRPRREDIDTTDDTTASSKRDSKMKEGKGNVLVNVRVRPDASNSEDSNADGEWLVDGRRTLVSYRGREGGDYYYGTPSYLVLLLDIGY